MKSLKTLFFLFLVPFISYSQSLDPVTLSANGTVFDMERSGDTLFVGGDFSEIGFQAPYLSIIDPTTSQPAFDGPAFNSSVYVSIPDGNGGWYVGGFFTSINSSNNLRLVHLLADYSVDENFECDLNGGVEALYLDGNDLYIGGSFSTVNSLAANRIARVNASTGSLDASWLPTIDNGSVRDILVENGFVYVGGSFNSVEGTNDTRHLARFDISTGEYSQISSLNSTVEDLAVDNGDLFVAGSFSSAEYYKSHLAFFNENNIIPRADRGDLNSTAEVIIPDGDGGWYVGGAFSNFDGETTTRVIHILADGTRDENFVPENFNSTVLALHLDGNDLYVGGFFTSVGAESISRIARIDAITGALDLTWTPEINNGSVNAISTLGDDVAVGGSFSQVEGQSDYTYFARFDKTTGDAQSGPSVNTTVEDIENDGTDFLLGGSFTITGFPQSNLALVNGTSGLPDQAFPDVNSTVEVILEDGSGGWYIGGAFFSIDGESTNRLIHVLPDFSVDPDFNVNVNSTVHDLVLDGNDLYLGGAFTTINGVSVSRVARINATTGELDATWLPSTNSTVLAIEDTEDNLYIGGFFSSVNGKSNQRNFAALDKATAETIPVPSVNSSVSEMIDSDNGIFYSGTFSQSGFYQRKLTRFDGSSVIPDMDFPFTNGRVNEVISDGSGGYFVGGSFTQVNDVNNGRLVHVLADGTIDPAFTPVLNGEILDMYLDGNDLYLAGAISTAGGVAVNNLIRVNATDGSLDETFSPNVNSTVRAVAVDNGVVYFGGFFTQVNGDSRNYLASVDDLGATLAWNPDPNSFIDDLKIANGAVYVSGSFFQIGGTSRNRIASLDPSTGALNSFDAGSVNGTIIEMEISGNDLYIGGTFTTIAGNSRSRLALLNATTGALQALDVPFNNSILDLAIDGNLLAVGGNFTLADGETRNYFAEIDLNTSSLTSKDFSFNTSVITILYDGTSIITGGDFDFSFFRSISRIAELDGGTNLPTSFDIGNCNSTIEALLLNENELFIGGSFTSINGESRQRLASVDATTGDLNSFTVPLNNTVRDFFLDGNELYVAGVFTQVDGNTQNYAFRYDLGTSAVDDWAVNTDGAINEIVTNGTDVIIGGGFGFVNRVDFSRIAKYDISLNTFESVLDGSINSTVFDILIDGSDLYAGGSFTSVAGEPRTRLALVDLSTAELQPLDLSINSNVFTLLKQGDELFFGGSFTLVDGENRARAASYDLNSETLADWNPSFNSNVLDLEADGNGIVAVGPFSSIGAISRNRLLSIDLDNLSVNDFNLGSVFSTIRTVLPTGDDLIIGGDFTSINGETRLRIASVDKVNGTVNPLSIDINSSVFDLALDGDILYFGGSFTTVNELDRARVGSFDLNTSTLTDFNPKMSSTVRTLETSPDGLFIGGDFTRIGSENRSRFAAISISEKRILDFAENTGFTNSTITSIEVDANNVYVGGSFSTFLGESRSRLAVISRNDGSLTAFNPGVSGNVQSLLLDNNSLFLGGNFSEVGGQTRSNFAELDLSTELPTSLDFGTNSTVNALEKAGSTLYLGGSFTQIDGEDRSRIASIDLAGGTLNAFNGEANSTVEDLVFSDGLLYAAGSFSSIGGESRGRVASLNPSDGSSTDFNPNFNNTVHKIEIDQNYLFAGGSFTQVNGESVQRLVLVDKSSGDLLLNFTPALNSTVFSLDYQDETLFAGGFFTSIGANLLHPRLASWTVPGPGSASFSTELISTTNFNGFDIDCNGNNVGEIEISVTGGTPPYEYTLTDANNSVNRTGTITSTAESGTESNLPAGSYSISITDSDAGLALGSILLTEPADFEADLDITSEVTTVGGSEAVLSISLAGGTGVIDYSYTVDGGTPINGQIVDSGVDTEISGLAAGNYVFEFTDENSCTTSASITIDDYEPVNINFTIWDEITCNGDLDGQLRIQLSQGIPPYDYVLDSDDDTYDRSGTLTFNNQAVLENDLGPGEYNLEVTDATGAVSNAGPLTLSDPEIIQISASVSSIETFPGANDGSIDLTISGGSPGFSFSYTQDGSPFSSGFDADGIATVVNLPAGTYVFTVTDANGCQVVSDPIEVGQGDDPCENLGGDADNDGICDDNDPCIGFFDALGVCNGDCPADVNNNGICDTDEAGEDTGLTCADGVDNDGDGLIDCEDPDCQAFNANLGCTTCFNDGLSFADQVLSYENNCTSNVTTDPTRALGSPDFETGNQEFVTLGRGELRLGFTNNTLINSGDSDPDLFVFEIGPAVEGTSIELRPTNPATIAILDSEGIEDTDGDGYYEFGSIGGSTASIDIDAFLSGLDANSVQFNAIKLVDNPGSCSGTTPGADIDAVCALSSLPCTVGESCDDGDPNTINDELNASCNCVGTFVCNADAGTIDADNSTVELDQPEVTISATPNGDAVDDFGYSTLFVLTSGNDLIIEQTSSSAEFLVAETGLFTIHTLIYDADPTSDQFLDLSGIQLGTTPASAVLDQISDNGLCADLDAVGAPIDVIECDEGDSDGDGFCDDVDPCPELANLENGDSCGANGTVINCECVEVCPVELGTPSVECETETAGSSDSYTVSIPYTGIAPGANISAGNSSNCTNAFITVSGDDPASVANGTIVLTSTEEVSCWSITISSPSCDLTLEGDAPSCDPAVDCPSLGLNNGDPCGVDGSGTVVDCACLFPDCNGTLGGNVSDTDGDGICDDVDNCVNLANADQADLDGDGEGDLCDSDIDGDGVNNTADCAPTDPNFATEQTWFADNDGDGFGTSDDSQISCEQPVGFVDNDDDCDDSNSDINPSAQTLTFSGTGVFDDVILAPQVGAPSTVYSISVVYTDATGALPPLGFPRAILDFENNGNFNGPNDRTILLQPENSNDLNTVDGKVYTGTISNLTAGTNYTTRIRVANGDCQTEIGPFNYPDVLTEPDLEIFADDITFSNINPDVSSTLEINALIRNASDLPASNFSVDIVNQFDESIDYPEIIVPFLGANETVVLTWEITTPDEPAWCPVEVIVDNTNVIDESNELDNRAVRPFVNGDFEVPGDIIANANVSPAVQVASPGATVTVFGFAEYIDTALPLDDPSVAGGTVTLTTSQGAVFTGLTNSQGFFSISFPVPQTPGIYTVNGEITDFTLTGDFTLQFEIVEPVITCLPDLVTNLELFESTIFVGESTEGTVTVVNNGCAATTIPTRLDINQTGGIPALSDFIVPPLQVGESVQFDLAELTFNNPGFFTVCGSADADFEVQESNEFNNTDCDGINVLIPLPDLAPNSGPFGSQFICTNPANPSFSIRNFGNVPSGQFDYEVEAFFNGQPDGIFSGTIANLNANQSQSFSIPYDYDEIGSYSFTVSVDVPLPNGQVVEISETNNVGNYARSIVECQPDLIVLSCGELEVNPVDPAFPGTVTYQAKVQNAGNAVATQPIEFEFQVSNGQTYAVEIQEDIAPGQVVDVEFDAAPTVESGLELLTGFVDPNDLIDEFIENNNSYADSLCWEFAPVQRCGFDFWNQTYSPGQTTVVSVGLDVDHLYKASEVTMRFEVEGPGIPGTALLGDVAVPNVETTCNCPRVISLPNTFLFTELGTYTFTFTIDPEGEYSECNEENNVLQVEVEVTTLADMRILSEFINPTLLNPAVNESVFFDITYENISVSNPEVEMDLAILIDEIPFALVENVPGLIQGTNTTISVPMPYSTDITGAHIVRAIIDSNDEIEELNELNNEATRAFVVGEAANLFFEVFQPDDASPSIGQGIQIDATIGNNGALDVDADVLFSFVNTSGDTIQIGSLPVSVIAGGSQAISLPWNVVNNNTELLGEIVNASEIEFNYDDNFASANLGSFEVEITSVPFCEGQNVGSLTASASGGNEPYTYSWNTGFIGQTLEAEPGNYVVTVTDNDGFESTAVGTIGIDEACVEPECDLNAVSFTVGETCDPATGLFPVSLTVSYENEPEMGFISVNGQEFEITGSPQSLELSVLEGPVNFDVSFSENSDCSLFIMTGVNVSPCEEDCEGVLGGNALPGTPCEVDGIAGTYDDNCNCIPNVNCSLIVNSVEVSDNCDPETGLFSASVELSYMDAPMSGVLVVNEEEFDITQSPQIVELTFVSGPVVIEAFFSDEPTCNTLLETSIVLEACEEDCEGTFGGSVLPGTACEVNGAAGTLDENCNCVPDPNCSLIINSVDVADNCDPETGLYSASVELSYSDAPSTGVLVVNSQEFDITNSPQTVELTFSSGQVVIEAFFSDEGSCGALLTTGLVLDPCEQDCEGVFGGTALPGTPCEANGLTGLYNSDCECIVDPGCTADGGIITTQDPLLICAGDGTPNVVTVDLIDAEGENGAYLITSQAGTILLISEENSFDFDQATVSGFPLIWHLSWDGEVSGLMMGANAFEISGDCFDLSNSIEVQTEVVNGGTISTNDPTTFCVNDGLADVVNVSVQGEKGRGGRFILTDEDLNFQGFIPNGQIDFEGSEPGTAIIWYVAYSGPIQAPAIGTNIADVDAACFALSNPIEITKESCDEPEPCPNFRYFLANNNNNGSSDIYEVSLNDDLDRGDLTLLKSVDYPVHIAYDGSKNELYLVRSSNGSFARLDVSQVDGNLSSEIAVDIDISGVVTTAFDEEGIFYIGAESTDKIYTVNTTNGATVEFADANISGGDIAFVGDEELYHVTRANGGRLNRIVPEGANVNLGSVTALVTGLAAKDDGNLLLSTKDETRLFETGTSSASLDDFYDLFLDEDVFTMNNGDMASGCAKEEDILCENFEYYYADHGPGISGTNIYGLQLGAGVAELSLLTNLPYQAHIAHSDDETNTLYFVNANGSFLEVYDPATDEAVEVSIDGDIDQLFAVVYNPMDELLYVGDANSDEVYTIDPVSGATAFFSEGPVQGGDLALVDGELYLAKRNSSDLFKFVDGNFELLGSLPSEVNGMSSTDQAAQLLVASGESSTFSIINSSDGTVIEEFTAVVDGEEFILSNGDLASGCIEPSAEELCNYQLFYAHQSTGNENALYSLVANGEGGYDLNELATDVGDAHLALVPEGDLLYVVDGSGSFRTFDIDSETFGPVINISDANGNISGTPAAVAASDGSLLVASSNRDHVYLVNASTGFATEVGREIPVAGGDLVFDAEGVLWYINRNTGTFYDVNGTDEFSVALSEINGAALLEDGSIILAEGDENGLMYGVDMVNQELDGNIYEVPLELFWGDLAGGCSVASSSSEPEMLISSEEFAQGWITAYPNPNEGMTAISFQTATKGDAVVEVFDLTGTKVDEVYSGFVSEETIYRLELNRPDLPNGVYLYRLTKADEVLMGKFIISK